MSREYDQIKGLIRNTEECLSTAYKRGYKDGKSSVDKPTYEQGLNDAWEYALKVGMYGCEYYKNNVFPKNPNYDVWDILRHYSASEVIAKIKEYEKSKKLDDIKVGDEVYWLDPNHKSVVTAILEDCKKAVLISASGKWATEYLKDLHKTGKHYS